MIARPMALKFLLSAFILSFSTELCRAQDHPAVPLIEYGVCPFECCQFGRWLAESPLTVYQSEDDTSTTAYTIAVGDSFLATTGNVHIERPGVVVVTKPVESFKPGDTLYALSNRGEGSIDIWRSGAIQNIDIFWDCDDAIDFTKVDPRDPRWDRFSGVLLTRPLMVWWVQVQDRRGRMGWIRLVNTTIEGFSTEEQIGGMDACE